MALLATPFNKTCMHVCKSHSNETVVIRDCWIRSMVVCVKTGRLCYPLLTQCLNRVNKM